jgi:hypothetical protein
MGGEEFLQQHIHSQALIAVEVTSAQLMRGHGFRLCMW